MNSERVKALEELHGNKKLSELAMRLSELYQVIEGANEIYPPELYVIEFEIDWIVSHLRNFANEYDL